MDYTANSKVETTAKSFHIIEYLAATDGGGVSEVSEALEINKSIVHNHLSTLRELGYVRKWGDKYHLSLRFLEVGVEIRNRSPLFQAIERRVIVAAKQFETTAYLLERDGATGVLTRVWNEGDADDSTLGLGERIQLTESPLGLALLAELPEEHRQAITEQSTTGTDAVLADLPGDGETITGTSDISGETIVASGLSHGDRAGAVGLVLHPGARNGTKQSIQQAIGSLPEDSRGRNERTKRSFTTTKHSWFSE
jgi:DNA-binding MarR family transcriptional regulator